MHFQFQRGELELALLEEDSIGEVPLSVVKGMPQGVMAPCIWPRG